MTLPDQLTAAEFERLKAQEQRMLNSGSWVPQAENVHAARLNESAARESMPDMMSAEQADVAAAEQSVMAETPFGRSVGAEPDYSSTPAVNPADSEPKTIDELRRRQKEVYHDPTYDMPFDEWREYTNWERENSGAVEGFLGGLSGAPQALGQLGFNLVKERGQQYLRVMGGDPIGALDTEVATFKEMGRKVGVGLTQFVDWVGGKVNDMVTSGRRVGQKQAQIVAALREDGKLTGDPMQDNDTIRMAMEEAAAQGMFDESQNERTDDEQTKYERYLRQKQYDRDYASIFEYSLGGNRVTLPGVKQSFANPITGNVAQPQEATATVGAMVFDPVNAVPIGAGALSKVRMLRRLASVTGTPLKYAEQLGATADSWLMRQGDRITSKIPLVGDLPLGQRAAVLAGAAGVGAYVDSKTDGGLSLVTTPLMVAGGILPVMKASGTVLRKTGAVGGAGWQIVKEMDAGGIGAARAATAERMASSGAFGQFSQYMRPGASGVESSLRRVSMNPDAPETLRRVARSADNIGITQVARAADDLVSSSLVAGATAVPFALVAPDEQTAGQIVGGAMTLGGALGTAGRFLGRRSARADADISRMLVDVEMAGGDAKSLLSLDYASLDWLAAQQGLTQGKVDVIPLRAQEYRANVDIKNSGAETVAGLHLDRTVDGRAKIYVNMGHTAPIAGRVSVKDVQITRNGKTEKASVVRIKGEDGKSDFTVVPKEYPLLVKSGDVVGENTHLARGLSPRRIMPHEIGHAILTSNILDGAIRDDMRNLVNQQYGADGIEARGREYVTRLVDRDIMAGAHDALPDKLTQQEFDDIAAGKVTMADVVKGKPLNDAERTRLINERMEEMRDQSRAAGNNPDGLDVFRDEVVAETFSSLSESIDFRKMRTGGPRVMESIYNGMTRVFETLGLNFDQSTGKLLDNPSVIFRDNPLTKDPVMRKRLQEHLRNYEALMVNMEQAGQRKQRGTPVSSDGTAESARRSTHTKLRPNDNGILENDIIFIDQNGNAQWKPQNMLDEQERGRASQVMFLYDKDKILPANSKEFGRRRAADGRILISGPTLPAKFDALRWFPRWLRPNKSTSDIGLARTLEASRDEGMSYIFDVNVIGSGESGRYRVKNRGDIRAVIREGAFIGWQATKNHHLNAVVLDLNAFRSSAMKAINDGKLGVFNNDMTQLQADLMQYMSNHKNGLPGEAGIGIEKRDLLNGLIGTGTAVQRAANPLYSDLNPRGSIRTFRVDRLNDAQPTGRTGYHIDYDKINNNRMPSALPQAGMAMPDAPANLTTDQILRELEENQGYLGLSTLGMREGRPVKGGAQRTRELLKRNTALNEELRRRGGPQEESDVDRVLRQRGQAMPDVMHSPSYKLSSKVPARGHFLVGAITRDGRKLEYKLDPRAVVQPPVKDIRKYKGEHVMVLEADRYNTLDGRMGGPMHPWLKSNQVIVRTPDGKGYKAGWANMTSTFVSGARNKSVNNTDTGRALIQVMAEDTHRSNRDSVFRYMDKVDAVKPSMTQQQVDSLHVLLELGARMGQKETLPAPQKKFVKAMATVKSQATRGNKSNAEALFKKAMQKHGRSAWFQEIAAKFANISFTDEAARFTFPQRSSAMDKIDGLPFLPSLKDDLAASADFVGAKNLDVVASIQLSQNPDAFAVYFGKNPAEEAKMTATERNLRDQFLANKEFRVHPSYDWMMLSPENADNFILEKPVALETLFPWYRKAHPKASVKNGSPETVAGAMRKYGGIKLKL